MFNVQDHEGAKSAIDAMLENAAQSTFFTFINFKRLCLRFLNRAISMFGAKQDGSLFYFVEAFECV